MIKEERASLACSPEIENMELVADEAFLATLNRLRSVNGDLPRLWHQFTKNRPYSADSREAIKISEINSSDAPIDTEIERELANPGVIWISFGGNKLNTACRLNIRLASGESYVVQNAHSEETVAKLLPAFEHNDKHRKEPYYDYERKVHVAAMPIRDVNEAGALLRIGLPDGADIISYHRCSKKMYRFKLTGGNVYHGFEITDDETPPGLRAKFNRK